MKSLVLLSALALVALLAACGDSDDGAGSGRTLTVFAAASLETTFTELGKQFEADHSGTRVRFSFGGSSDLVEQIENGAPADVFASADAPTMDKLSQASDGRPFASNRLEIATPPDNPAKVTALPDLARSGAKVVTCAVPVPCGSATQQLEQKAGVTLKPVSQEQSVTDVLGKVESGEADAGIVYVTDVEAAGDQVAGVEIPDASNVVTTDVITAIGSSAHFDLAQQFVDFVLGDKGQQVLRDAGFGKP